MNEMVAPLHGHLDFGDGGHGQFLSQRKSLARQYWPLREHVILTRRDETGSTPMFVERPASVPWTV